MKLTTSINDSCCNFAAINGGQCLTGLAFDYNETQAAAAALDFFVSLLEQKFGQLTIINPAAAEGGEEQQQQQSNKQEMMTSATRQLLVVQFIHQLLDKLINKQQIGGDWINDPDGLIWNRLIDFADPEPLIDLLACLAQFAEADQEKHCHHLVALNSLYATAAAAAKSRHNWLDLFLEDLLDRISESCVTNRIDLLDKSIVNFKKLDGEVDLIIDELIVGATTTETTNSSKSLLSSSSSSNIIHLHDDWQHAEMICQFSHQLDLMNGTQFEALLRRKLHTTTTTDTEVGPTISLMNFCADKLQPSEPIKLVDTGEGGLLKVDRYRSSLLSNVALDGKSRKWIQFWLLCHKLL